MLPPAHRTLLARQIAEARDLAERGRLAAGDALLSEGLRYALELLCEGSPWAAELLLHLFRAQALYARRYGVPLD